MLPSINVDDNIYKTQDLIFYAYCLSNDLDVKYKISFPEEYNLVFLAVNDVWYSMHTKLTSIK